MAFNPQQIAPIDFNPSAAVGVDIPFNGNAVFKSNFTTKDSIKNNLINFFLTNPGERFLNPTFGGGIRDFVFTQISNNNIDFLKEDISSKLGLYFPNVSIISLNIFREDNLNSINIELKYEVLNTNITDELNIEF
jgi:phage baseplate assembly protein W|tara:strand:+ start:2260 stop:2664 length:405 start_codon:yes stop_codon:yes gene_type:complete